MLLINFEDIYKRALVRIDDLDLADLKRDDFYEYLKEWLHSSISNPFVRQKFNTFSIDDDMMRIRCDLNDSVDDTYDYNFVVDVLAKGIIINYFPSRIDTSIDMATAIGGKEEKVLNNKYKEKQERLNKLQNEFYKQLTQHGYYFTTYGKNQ